MTDMKGLTAYIYKNPLFDGTSLGGVSDRCDKVTVVGTRDERYPKQIPGTVEPLPRDCQVFKPTDEAPAVVLVYRNMGETQLVHAEPAEQVPAEQGTPWMSGGSYIASSDSRFGEVIGFYGAVSFHDRSESWRLYDAMSR